MILGEWINIFVHMKRQLSSEEFRNIPDNRSSSFKWSEITLESLRLQNIWSFWLSSCIVSYSLYLGIGGFLHVSIETMCLKFKYYYVSSGLSILISCFFIVHRCFIIFYSTKELTLFKFGEV